MLLYCILSATQLELGPVCNEMWSKAGSNLIVPGELNVDPKKAPWFTLTSAGQAKIASSEVFKKFEGSYSIECL